MLTLYDFRTLWLNFKSPTEDILTSLPAAMMRSASFRIMTWRRPEGVSSSSWGSTFANFESVVVDNSRRSREFDKGPSNDFGRENIGWSRRMSDHSSVADMANFGSSNCRDCKSRLWFPTLTDALLARPHKLVKVFQLSWLPSAQATIFQRVHIPQMVVFFKWLPCFFPPDTTN